MTNFAGRTSLEKYFDFPPGSRVGVTKSNIIIPQVKDDGRRVFIKFEKGDICEIMEDRITNRTDDYEYPSVYATTQPRVVYKSGHGMPGPKLVPRGTWGIFNWTNSSNEGALKQRDWPIEYKRMPSPASTQAVLMDEFEKEAQDDARYNAVPSRAVPSKIEHF